MSIQLIVGLGNIGQEYAQTRHNAGWWMLDELAATWGASFREDKKYYAEVAKANTPQGEVICWYCTMSSTFPLVMCA